MSLLFDKVIACAGKMEQRLKESGTVTDVSVNSKINSRDTVFTSGKYRRAHISTIDARASNKLYLLHVTIFPHTNDSSPIYGFDIVCGPTKVSGAFHDYSASGDQNHSMCRWFANKVAGMEWNKPRDLPEWARYIFSNHMVAIGAVNSEELDEFIDTGLTTLKYYLDTVGNTQEWPNDYHMSQNRYCFYQKQNPRTPASLQHLGFTEEEAKAYVQEMLFPEIG
jgi:hypothetical protein